MVNPEMKPELLKLGMDITAELFSVGMDDNEIMDFWQECLKEEKKRQIINQN